jgi:hypothetical protein
MNEDTELVIIRHPRRREQFRVKLEDPDDRLPGDDRIPLYN